MMPQADFDRRLEALEARLSALEASVTRNDTPVNERVIVGSPKKTSVREFLNEKNPSTGNDRVVAFAYYLEHYEDIDDFTIEQLRNLFRLAKIVAPKNLNDAVNQNVTKGFVMETGVAKGSRTWTLTNTGEAYYNNGLKSDAK